MVAGWRKEPYCYYRSYNNLYLCTPQLTFILHFSNRFWCHSHTETVPLERSTGTFLIPRWALTGINQQYMTVIIWAFVLTHIHIQWSCLLLILKCIFIYIFLVFSPFVLIYLHINTSTKGVDYSVNPNSYCWCRFINWWFGCSLQYSQLEMTASLCRLTEESMWEDASW